MTAQINDVFKFNGIEYHVIGIDGPELFDPVKEGFKPKMASTACYRGFYLTYLADNMYLYLDEMQIRQDDAKVFNNIKPIKGDYFFSHKYINLKYKLPFTGRIIIAKDFIQEMYVHMGFQKASAYKTVIELIIENGDVKEIKDHSEYYRKIREENRDYNSRPRNPSDEAISTFVEDSFSRRIDDELDKD